MLQALLYLPFPDCCETFVWVNHKVVGVYLFTILHLLRLKGGELNKTKSGQQDCQSCRQGRKQSHLEKHLEFSESKKCKYLKLVCFFAGLSSFPEFPLASSGSSPMRKIKDWKAKWTDIQRGVSLKTRPGPPTSLGRSLCGFPPAGKLLPEANKGNLLLEHNYSVT